MTPQDARLIDAANEIHETLDRVTWSCYCGSTRRVSYESRLEWCADCGRTLKTILRSFDHPTVLAFNAVRSMGRE